MKQQTQGFLFNPKFILAIQVLTLSFIWLFFLGIDVWIINLIILSSRLKDVPSASIGISIVAIPVFFTLAAVLTYVFWGLHKRESQNESHE
jgi:hypothetical protein